MLYIDDYFFWSGREAFKIRRDLIVDRLNSIDGISCDLPGGAFYVFPNISKIINRNLDGKIIKNSLDLCMLLLERQSVVSVSGDSFGADQNIRFSYATSEEIINKAMDKLKELIDECE